MIKLISTLGINSPYTHTVFIPSYGLFYVHAPISSAEVLTRSLLRQRLHNFKGYHPTRYIFVVYFNLCRFYLTVLAFRVSKLFGTLCKRFCAPAKYTSSYISTAYTHRKAFHKLGTRKYSTSIKLGIRPNFKQYSCFSYSSEIILSDDTILKLINGFWIHLFNDNDDQFLLVQGQHPP